MSCISMLSVSVFFKKVCKKLFLFVCSRNSRFCTSTKHLLNAGFWCPFALAFPRSPSFAFKTYSNCFSTSVIVNRIPDLSE